MSLIQSIKKKLSQYKLITSIYALSHIGDIRRTLHYKHNLRLEQDDYPIAVMKYYKKSFGKPLNLDNPKTFDEKVMWLNLYDANPLKTQLADKYSVRKWVSEKIGEEYLIPILGVWDSFDEIDFDSLPNQFVLKANHGSSWNIIVKDKSNFDVAEAKQKFNHWMNLNYGFLEIIQLQYINIPPRIIAEKYLENNNGELSDYKFHCFNGTPKYIQYMTGRENHDTLCEKIFDLNWGELPFVQNYPKYPENVPCPQTLNRMTELVQNLSEDFPYVRVDLYSLDDGSIKFGEMTFTPGFGNWNPSEYIDICGDYITLPKEKKT